MALSAQLGDFQPGNAQLGEAEDSSVPPSSFDSSAGGSTFWFFELPILQASIVVVLDR